MPHAGRPGTEDVEVARAHGGVSQRHPVASPGAHDRAGSWRRCRQRLGPARHRGDLASLGRRGRLGARRSRRRRLMCLHRTAGARCGARVAAAANACASRRDAELRDRAMRTRIGDRALSNRGRGISPAAHTRVDRPRQSSCPRASRVDAAAASSRSGVRARRLALRRARVQLAAQTCTTITSSSGRVAATTHATTGSRSAPGTIFVGSTPAAFGRGAPHRRRSTGSWGCGGSGLHSCVWSASDTRARS